MTGPNPTRDPDSILAAWLDEGPTDLPEATRRAILTALPTTPQAHRGLFGPWSLRPTPGLARGAAVLVVAVGAIVLLSLSGFGLMGGRPAPTVDLFRSPLYGYSILIPGGWSATPATVRWDGQSAPSLGPNVDQLAGPRLIVLGYAAPFAGDLAAFVQDQIAAGLRDHSDTCPSNALQLDQPTTIGGEPGVLLGLDCGARIDQAITVHDGVGYAFTIRDAGFSPTLDPTDLATVQSMLDKVIFPARPIQSP